MILEFNSELINGMLMFIAFAGFLHILFLLAFLVNENTRSHKEMFKIITCIGVLLGISWPVLDVYFNCFQLLNHHVLFFSFI